jgi:hypothetical protein
MATKQLLEQKLARLESTHDQLVAELSYIDQLMRLVGFTTGISGLKETAIELYKNEHQK